MKTVYPTRPAKSLNDWLIYINQSVNKRERTRKVGNYYIKNRKVCKAYNQWLNESKRM